MKKLPNLILFFLLFFLSKNFPKKQPYFRLFSVISTVTSILDFSSHFSLLFFTHFNCNATPTFTQKMSYVSLVLLSEKSAKSKAIKTKGNLRSNICLTKRSQTDRTPCILPSRIWNFAFSSDCHKNTLVMENGCCKTLKRKECRKGCIFLHYDYKEKFFSHRKIHTCIHC